ISDAVRRNAEIELNRGPEEDDEDDDVKDILFPAMAAMGVFMTALSALYYVSESFSGAGVSGKGKRSVFGFIYSSLKYLAVFIGTVAAVFIYKKFSGSNEE
ncbi:MAG TPA: hypothetical protein PKL57_18170, partial [Candidatus Wallbacteria bacterium]|nr:hypothetical protein [Candidatus Wallbacteria bacterium]